MEYTFLEQNGNLLLSFKLGEIGFIFHFYKNAGILLTCTQNVKPCTDRYAVSRAYQ